MMYDLLAHTRVAMSGVFQCHTWLSSDVLVEMSDSFVVSHSKPIKPIKPISLRCATPCSTPVHHPPFNRLYLACFKIFFLVASICEREPTNRLFDLGQLRQTHDQTSNMVLLVSITKTMTTHSTSRRRSDMTFERKRATFITPLYL